MHPVYHCLQILGPIEGASQVILELSFELLQGAPHIPYYYFEPSKFLQYYNELFHSYFKQFSHILEDQLERA